MPAERAGLGLRAGGALVAAALLLCRAGGTRAEGVATAPVDSISAFSTHDLEQLMKLEVVFAGSRHAQKTRDVPSFVSVVTAADIKAHGYRTLSDVLGTLPGFYVTNDRNYSYIGVRGFDRPGDYSSRILLLLNGLRTNDNIYDQAYIGEEFNVDVDLIDRVEVIRGPSAALYGSNAFFAVINVVTKQASSLQGGEAVASAASFGTNAGRMSYGRAFANDAGILVSASYSDSKGQRLYFPEFDSPATNNGIADRADREGFDKLLAIASKGNFSFQASNDSREKGIPTGSYATLFNDSRSRTIDGLTLTSLSYNRSYSNGASFATRVHAGQSTYTGKYAYDPSFPPNQDEVRGDWWGVDVDATRAVLSHHFLTAGLEYRDNYKQIQQNFDPDPYVLYTDVRSSSIRWGAFAQDEIKILQPLTLYAGVRLDRYQAFGSATSPRVGMIFTPGRATTLKLLAGRAFRAPNEFELHYNSSLFRANPRLQPEQIETLELIAQRLIGSDVQVSGSAFRNRISGLISERIDPADNNRLVFENAGEIESKGVELGLKVNKGHGPTGELTYSLQRTEDRATGIELTNSPRQMTKLLLLAPLGVHAITAGLDAQYTSGRRTLAGGSTDGAVVTNLSLLAPRTFGRFDVSGTIYNLFDVRYDVPGSDEHTQDIIQQDGRSFRVKSTLHY